MNEYQSLFNEQTKNRWNLSQTSANERREKLKKLKSEVIRRREEIKLALYKDFKKPFAESELTEIHPILDELNFAIKHLKAWMKPKKVPTPIVLFGSKSEIRYEARGLILLFSPWNYPFNLMLSPLVAAVAAGNCVIAKPSEKTPHTGLILKEIIEAVFKSDEVALILGEIETAEKLLELPFDYIFFTGSTAVGKKIMAAASKNLSTVTLELGGKSPVIIDSEVDLESTVERLVWGKFINSGQTCVAPDYLFVPLGLKDSFVKLFVQKTQTHFGAKAIDRMNCPDFARLIDQRSGQRLFEKLKNEKNLIEGTFDLEKNYCPPTLIETSLKSPIMEDEIFGPVLPLITYQKIEEVINYIQSQPKPLSLYIFSKNKSFVDFILNRTTSGGVAVNQVILHLANPYLPFGGVGHSGLGSYHGHYGFKTFSHERSILIQKKLTFAHFYFPPYSRWISKMAFKLLRLFE
jgi:aldehyde dehydrogenase (NAD+)